MIGADAIDYFKQQKFHIYTSKSLWTTLAILLIQGIVYMTFTIILDNIKFRLNDKQNLSND